MRDARFMLFGTSLLIALHALAVSRYLASTLFLIVFCCWLLVGALALLERLEAVRSMTITMLTILTAAAVTMNVTSLVQVDMKAFFLLGFFPSFTAWICVYLYVRHLQKVQQETRTILVERVDEGEPEWIEEAEHALSMDEKLAEDRIIRLGHRSERQSHKVRVSARRVTLKAAS